MAVNSYMAIPTQTPINREREGFCVILLVWRAMQPVEQVRVHIPVDRVSEEGLVVRLKRWEMLVLVHVA